MGIEPAITELPTLARFDVVKRVGEGGMGIVYEAVDRDRGTRVALKMLRDLDGETVLRLKGEFRALQDIEHPNLVRLGELTFDDGNWFFTMELIEGPDLVEWVAGAVAGAAAGAVAGGDDKRLRHAFAQLARALGALHAAGKVHRDVKPSNVLVDAAGRVVLLDFGLVRDTAEAPPEELDLVLGTILYMAPEQGAGEAVGPPADWYALGAILYQSLTGRTPFEGSGADVITRKLTLDPPRPSQIRSGVPEDLDALCMALLARDPAERPSGHEVLRVLEPRSASERPPTSTTIAPGSAPFVGRSRELALLREAFERSAKGASVILIVEGESGVGKSAVTRRFLRERVDAADALVLAGRCYEREDVPYKAIDGVIDAVSRQLALRRPSELRALLPASAFVLAHAFPVLRRVPGMERASEPKAGGGQESRAILFGAMRELFANLAGERPLVVAIDDLQWADADSLVLLAEILRPPSPAMLFVATARAPSTPRALGEAPFGLPGDVTVVPLSRLGPTEGLQLVRALGGDMSASTAQRIANEAGGHPLFVDELVRHAQLQDGYATGGAVHLDDALVARAGRVEPDTRALLDVIAVAGVALSQDIAMRAAGLSIDDFGKHAQILRAAHLAQTHGWRGEDAIEPYHDRVREAVAANLTDETRRSIHGRIAVALESAKVKDADALSTHWLAAGDGAKAGTYARIAAEQARTALAFDRAARLYERALAHAPLSDEAKQATRIDLAETLANAGRGREAAEAFFNATTNATSAESALDLRRRASEELLIAGRLDEGDAALKEVLAAVGLRLPRTPLGALLRLLFFRFVLFLRGLKFEERDAAKLPPQALTRVDTCNGVGRVLSVIDPICGSYFETRALVEALALGEPQRIARALAVEAAYVSFGGPRNAARAMELLDRSSAIASRGSNVLVTALVHTATGFSHFLLGRFREAVVSSDRASSLLRESAPGGYWDLRTAEHCAIWSTAWMGELDALAKRVELGIREAEQRGDLYAGATLRTGVLNLASLRHGDTGAARARVADASRRWTQRGYHMQHYWALLASAHIDLYDGLPRDAMTRVTREWSALKRSLILEVGVIRMEALQMRARTSLAYALELRGSEREQQLSAAERDARALDGSHWAIATPMAHGIRAGISAIRGDTARASTDLEASARGFEAVSMVLHAATARYQLGRLRGGDEGRELIEKARAWMESQGIADPAKMSAMTTPGFAP